MFEVKFNLRYCRVGRRREPDYTKPASVVYTVNILGLFSTPRVTGLKVLREDWDFDTQTIKGTSEEIQYKNRRLRRIKTELDKLEQELSIMNDYFTSQYLVDVYSGKKDKKMTVSKAFENYLEILRNPDNPEEVLKIKHLKNGNAPKNLSKCFFTPLKWTTCLSFILPYRWLSVTENT